MKNKSKQITNPISNKLNVKRKKNPLEKTQKNNLE